MIIPPEKAADRVASAEPSREPGAPTMILNLKGRDIYIHSMFHPMQEARRWARSRKLKPGAGRVFVFGFGLGYHVEALLEEHPEIKKLYVIEVSPDIFHAALAARDFSRLLADERLNLLAGPYPKLADSIRSLVDSAFDADPANETDILIHRPSLDAIPDDGAELRDILEYLKLTTRKSEVFAKERSENIEANRAAFESAPGVKELFGSYAGRPLIVAAAGPSLDISIEMLACAPAAPDIVAVDSALAPFHSAGLRPHFVVTGDPQKKTFDLFAGLELKEERLIFFPSSNPGVVAMFAPDRRFAAYSSVSEKEKELDSRGGKGLLNFSGTVLMAAVDFAFHSGADPIILIGADFSFDSERTHATGSRTQGYVPRYGRRRAVPSIDEGEVQTSDILYLYKRDLEDYYIENIHEKRNLINATARGAVIFHVPHISLDRCLIAFSNRKP